MRYHILEGSSRLDLLKMVRSYIKDGWIPQGGISTYVESAMFLRVHYTQAMIKEDK